MMCRKRTIVMIAAHVILLASAFLMAYLSFGYVSPGPQIERIKFIRNFTVQVGSEEPRPVTLPCFFRDLPPRTPITLTTIIVPEPDEEILVESKYCPGKVYLDDQLGYEFGKEGQFPDFMLDPPVEFRMIETHGLNEPMTLRLQFFSPVTQHRMVLEAF